MGRTPTAAAIFGSFTTVAAPTDPGVTLVDTFTLTITQSGPAPGGALVFTSSVGGRIFLNNSEAFVQFDDPLVQAITSGGASISIQLKFKFPLLLQLPHLDRWFRIVILP